MGMLQPFQDCGAIIREIAGRVKRILDMSAIFVWYFKEENTLRFWRLCGRIEKNTLKGNSRSLMQRFGALEVAMRQNDLASGGPYCDCGDKKKIN